MTHLPSSCKIDLWYLWLHINMENRILYKNAGDNFSLGSKTDIILLTQVKEVALLFLYFLGFSLILLVSLNHSLILDLTPLHLAPSRYLFFRLKYWSCSHKILKKNKKKQDQEREELFDANVTFKLCIQWAKIQGQVKSRKVIDEVLRMRGLNRWATVSLLNLYPAIIWFRQGGESHKMKFD